MTMTKLIDWSKPVYTLDGKLVTDPVFSVDKMHPDYPGGIKVKAMIQGAGTRWYNLEGTLAGFSNDMSYHHHLTNTVVPKPVIQPTVQGYATFLNRFYAATGEYKLNGSYHYNTNPDSPHIAYHDSIGGEYRTVSIYAHNYLTYEKPIAAIEAMTCKRPHTYDALRGRCQAWLLHDKHGRG
jgi:hypothetical protein